MRASSQTITTLSCRQCDNSTDLAQLSCSGCWGGGGALWRACNLTAFIHSSTGPVVHPFASHHEGPGFNPQGGRALCETGILLLVLSRHSGLLRLVKKSFYFYSVALAFRPVPFCIDKRFIFLSFRYVGYVFFKFIYGTS
jgi:hypothetical protein